MKQMSTNVKCINGFIGCLTEGKYYEILSVNNQYVAVVEDDGRINWSFIGNFEYFDIKLIKNKNISFNINWNIL